MGKQLMNAALKQLIREEGVVEFESAPDIPDGKVLVPTSGGPKGPVPPRVQATPPASKAAKSQKGAQPSQAQPPPATSSTTPSSADEDTLFG